MTTAAGKSILHSFAWKLIFFLITIDDIAQIQNEEGEATQEAVNANLPIRQYLDANIMPQLIEALE